MRALFLFHNLRIHFCFFLTSSCCHCHQALVLQCLPGNFPPLPFPANSLISAHSCQDCCLEFCSDPFAWPWLLSPASSHLVAPSLPKSLFPLYFRIFIGTCNALVIKSKLLTWTELIFIIIYPLLRVRGDLPVHEQCTKLGTCSPRWLYLEEVTPLRCGPSVRSLNHGGGIFWKITSAPLYFPPKNVC